MDLMIRQSLIPVAHKFGNRFDDPIADVQHGLENFEERVLSCFWVMALGCRRT
jgi:hypothetical protein